jgi:hypothetical protein
MADPNTDRKKPHETEHSTSAASTRRPSRPRAKVITILVAANFLVGSIYALYFAATPLQRLGLIQVLTTIFALCAGFMTNARRAELLAVTAA